MTDLLWPGHPVGLRCNLRWWPPWSDIVCKGISGWQTINGYGRWSMITHVGRYLGDGQVFEVTSPKARIVPVGEFMAGRAAILFRRHVRARDFQFSDAAIAYMREAAEKLVGMNYGYEDLIGHILDDLFGVPLSRWSRITDFWRRAFVCSSGDAYLEEYARRKLTDDRGAPFPKRFFGQCCAPGVGITAVEPWPRAFHMGGNRYIHTERVKPADYGRHPDYRVVCEMMDGR